MDRAEVNKVAKKYHLRFLPNSGRAQAWVLFEQGLKPDEIVNQNLLPGLKKVTVFSYFSEWQRRRS